MPNLFITKFLLQDFSVCINSLKLDEAFVNELAPFVISGIMSRPLKIHLQVALAYDQILIESSPRWLRAIILLKKFHLQSFLTPQDIGKTEAPSQGETGMMGFPQGSSIGDPR